MRDSIVNELADKIKSLMEFYAKNYDWKFSEEEYSQTPFRVANFMEEMYQKYTYKKFTVFDNVENYDEMVILRNINFDAFCSHHLLPFSGVVHVAYIPDKRVLGLSKIARIVASKAYQAQLQERMTKQIATTIQKATNARGVMVVVEATHLCIASRGVEQRNSMAVTSSITGVFKIDNKPRDEALKLMRIG